MKVRVLWDGNEDGVNRYLVSGVVKRLRVEVMTEAGAGEPNLDPVETSLVWDTKPAVNGAPNDGPQTWSAPVVVEKEILPADGGWLGRELFVAVKVGDARAVVGPLIVFRKSAVLIATLVSSLAVLGGLVWFVDVGGAMPRGHLSASIPIALGLPIAASVIPRLRALLSDYQLPLDKPPALGVFHRIVHALVLAVAVGVVIFVARRFLMTVHNETDTSMSVNSTWKLGPRERLVITKQELVTAPALRQTPGHESSEMLDRLFDEVEPAGTTLKCNELTVPCRALKTPAAEGGECNALNTRECSAAKVSLRAYAFDEQKVAARAGEDAMLDVALPWKAKAGWSDDYLRIQLVKADPESQPRAIVKRVMTSGPTLLVFDPLRGTESRVALTPFSKEQGALQVTLDEDLLQESVETMTDVEKVRLGDGGELSCRGFSSAAPVRILQLGARQNNLALQELRITAGSWSSTFVAHARGASHAWQCELPPTTARTSYRLAVSAARGGNADAESRPQRVELAAPPSGYDFEIVVGSVVGRGTCSSGNAFIQRFRAPQTGKEILTLENTVDTSKSTFQVPNGVMDEAWFCVPKSGDVKLAARRGAETLAKVGDAIEFPVPHREPRPVELPKDQ